MVAGERSICFDHDATGGHVRGSQTLFREGGKVVRLEELNRHELEATRAGTPHAINRGNSTHSYTEAAKVRKQYDGKV